MTTGWILPGVVFVILFVAVIKRVEVYKEFLQGAANGMKLTKEILPTLIGIMIATRVLRESGFLEFVTQGLVHILSFAGEIMGTGSENLLPAAVVPVIIMKMISSSAATGLVIDIFRTYGPDSVEGMLASVLTCCSETILYTMSVYFASVNITKTRWTLQGALFATMAGVVASVIIVSFL